VRQVAPPPPDHSWRTLYTLAQLGGFDVVGSIVDPATRLSGAVTLGTDGVLTVPLSGGWAAAGFSTGAQTVDPGTDGVYLCFPLYHRSGSRVSGDVAVDTHVRVRAPALVAADDVAIAYGLANDATLAGLTVDAVLAVSEWHNATGIRSRAQGITNGVAAALSNGGTAGPTGRGAETRMGKGGKGGGTSSGLRLGVGNNLIDADGVPVFNTGANPVAGIASVGTGDLWLVVALWRTNAANVTAKSVAVTVELGDIAMTSYA
jgi:hypothetical protein